MDNSENKSSFWPSYVDIMTTLFVIMLVLFVVSYSRFKIKEHELLKLAQKYGKKVFSVVGNMSIAMERRDFIKSIDCFVCNIQEAGILFFDDFSDKTPDEMVDILSEKVMAARIPNMIVTMGGDGAVYADLNGMKGYCPARKVVVKDTTGAGDSFCAGVAIGLTYGKTLGEACEIGSMLAASVIVTTESVCPRFLPRELGLEMDVIV
jgi:pseudouridine kinase